MKTLRYRRPRFKSARGAGFEPEAADFREALHQVREYPGYYGEMVRILMVLGQ